MEIQWFPGHMKKSLVNLESWLKNIDMVIVVLDARAPYSCLNNKIESLCANKDVLYCINKADLADPVATNEWLNYFETQGKRAIKIEANKSGTRKLLEAEIIKVSERKKQSKTRVSLINKFRVAIVGVPNTGKSTVLNTLAGTSAVKTGNVAGVTRNNTWIKIKNNIELMDNAGTLEPKLKDTTVAENLAILGSINDSILDETELSCCLLDRLIKFAPTSIKQRYGVDIENKDTYEILQEIAKTKGLLRKGGEIDETRVSKLLLTDFRSGRLGKVTIERVQKWKM